MTKFLASAAAGATMILAGCSGGGEDSGIVFASGGPISTADLSSYVGKTFPVRFAYGDSRTVDAEVGVSTGTLRVVDEDTLELVLNTGSIAITRTFTSVPGTDDFDNGSGYRIDSDRLDGLVYFSTSEDPGDNVNIAGAIGFQTPEANYPNTVNVVTYNQDAASALFFRNAGDDFFVRMFNNQVDLDVNFANSTISGALFDGSVLIDSDGDMADDDRVAVVVGMTGTLTGGGIDGTLSASATQDINDDGGAVDLNLAVTGSDVDGAFYGNSAGIVSGTYTGDYTFTDPIDGASSGSLSGYFDASR